MRRTLLHVVSFVSFAFGFLGLTMAQERVWITNTNGRFSEKYQVSAEDSLMRDGDYLLYYQDEEVESGRYDHGFRRGVWTFRGYHKVDELRYDYDRGQPVYILQHIGKTYNQKNYPSIFLGSPIVPFYFIMTNVSYPDQEKQNGTGGVVFLVLKISSTGCMTSYSVRKASSPYYANAVKKAAAKIPKNKWRWVPAMRNGQEVSSEYEIEIRFDPPKKSK